MMLNQFRDNSFDKLNWSLWSPATPTAFTESPISFEATVLRSSRPTRNISALVVVVILELLGDPRLRNQVTELRVVAGQRARTTTVTKY